MEIFTECNSCYFCQDKSCKLEKWTSPGFIDAFEENSGTFYINGRACPFYREPGYDLLDASPPEERVYKELRLNYGLVLTITDTLNRDTILDIIEKAKELDYPPRTYYVVDYRSNNDNHQNLVEVLRHLDVKFKTKKVLDITRPIDIYVDEFVMTKKLKEPFYIKTDSYLENSMTLGLFNKMYKDMIQVLYVGDESTYFTVTGIHHVCKDGFRAYLESKGHEKFIYNWQDIKNAS